MTNDVPSSAGSTAADVDTERFTHIESVMHRLQNKSAVYGILLRKTVLVRATQGTVITRLVLEPDHVNSSGGLHGAVSAAIVDFVTGLAISSWDLRETTGASVDMHLSYLSTAAVGDTLEVESKAERVGGNLAYVTVRIEKVVEGEARKLVTLGQHTKFVRGSEKTAKRPVGRS
jgi:acyl-coenzyme A thioesterase 13